MSSVVPIRFRDAGPVNLAQIGEIYRSIGPVRAEELICRSFERLSAHLARLEMCCSGQEHGPFADILTDIVSDAAAIGLTEMADVALNVLDCHESGDLIACAATLARLMRVSEPLLTMDTLDHTMPH